MGGYTLPVQLFVTDGTDDNTVDLINGPIYIKEWIPAGPDYKNSGVFQDSPLADGRVLVNRQFTNITETIHATISTNTPNGAIAAVNKLLNLLERAANYGSDQFNDTPIYIGAQGRGETNVRYATIQMGRIPQAEDPTGVLFKLRSLLRSRSVWENLDIIIEHEPWQSVPPGTVECFPVTVRPDLRVTTYVDRLLEAGAYAIWPQNESSGLVADNASPYGAAMDGTYTAFLIYGDPGLRVGEQAVFYSVGSGACDIYSTLLNTLFDGSNGTAVMWFRSSGPMWVSGVENYFLKLYVDANNYITLKHTTTDYEIEADYTVNGISAVATYVTSGPTEWFSLTIRWFRPEDIPGSEIGHHIWLYLDGILKAAGENVTGTAWTGNLSSSDCVIGASDTTGTDSISSDGNYLSLFSSQLSNNQILDLATNPYDITEETDCGNGIVPVSNKRTYVPLTHIYTYDASLTTYSSNLVTAALPHNLMPAAPAPNDILYLGIESGGALATGWFDNVLFDIGTAAVGSYTITWEYWSGATWSTLTVTDNTIGTARTFDRYGVCSVHWTPPSGWATTSINGTTAYWVRARISSFTSMTTVPQQANRNIYTNIVNWIDVPTIGGTIPALSRLQLENIGDKDGFGGSAPNLYVSRYLLGARTVSRGENFESIINLSDRQAVAGVTISLSGAIGTYASTTSSTGRAIRATAFTTASTLFTLQLDEALTSQYIGRFMLFFRVNMVNAGSGTTFSVLANYGSGGGQKTYTLPQTAVVTVGFPPLFPVGILTVGSGVVKASESYNQLQLVFRAEAVANTVDMYLHEVIFIPIDEWIMDTGFSYASSVYGSPAYIEAGRYLDLDGASHKQPRSLVRDSDSDSVADVLDMIGKRMIINQRERVRIHTMAGVIAYLPTITYSDPSVCHAVNLYGAKRYHLMRGTG